MRAIQYLTWPVCLLACLVTSSLGKVHIRASVEASWPAAAPQVQWLESIALDLPGSLFLAIHELANRTEFHRDPRLRNKAFRTKAFKAKKICPLFTQDIEADDVAALMDSRLINSHLTWYKPTLDSIKLSVALREGSVSIENMRILWQEREAQINDARPECENWVDVAGRKVCSPDEFWELVGRDQQRTEGLIVLPSQASGVPEATVLPSDHTTHEPSIDLPTVTMYAAPNHESFSRLFLFLFELARPILKEQQTPVSATGFPDFRPARLRLVLRWKPLNTASDSTPLVMSGYGAELDIKKSDYLVVDDRLAKGDPHARDVDEVKLAPVPKQDIQHLSIRAASYIMNSTEPFASFVHVTGDFPLVAPTLKRHVPDIPDELAQETYANQLELRQALQPTFSINGLEIPIEQVDPFVITRLLRKERQHVLQLTSLAPDMLYQDARNAIMHKAFTSLGRSNSTQVQKGRLPLDTLGELFDARDQREGGNLILWWNDLEKDRRYKTWSKSVHDLLKMTYPGAVNKVARNAMNAVLALDLTDRVASLLVTENIKTYVSRGIPVRFGIVPIVDDSKPASALLASILWHVVDVAGRSNAMLFLQELAAKEQDLADLAVVRRSYTGFVERLATQSSIPEPLLAIADIESKIDSDAAFQNKLKRAKMYAQRLSLKADGTPGACFLNGAYFPVNEEFTQNLQRLLSIHMQFFQQAVYFEEIDDKSDVSAYFYRLPISYARRNELIFVDPERNPLRVVNLVTTFQQGIEPNYMRVAYHEGVLYERDGDQLRFNPVEATLWIAADLDSEQGRQFVKTAEVFLNRRGDARIALLHNPVDRNAVPHPYSLSAAAARLIKENKWGQILPTELLEWLALDLHVHGPSDSAGEQWLDDNPLLPLLQPGAMTDADTTASMKYWNTILERLAGPFELEPGTASIVINGRIVGPIDPKTFSIADFDDLVDYELKHRIQPAVQALNDAESDNFSLTSMDLEERARLFAFATSLFSEIFKPDPAVGLFGGLPTERTRLHATMSAEHTMFKNDQHEFAYAEVVAIIDPATELAQKWAPVLHTLSAVRGVYVQVHLTPSLNVNTLPIKRFYRYVFDYEPSFEGGVETRAQVEFDDVPGDSLFTLGLDLQRSWLAFPKSSIYDLDNLRLADVSDPNGVQATFALESLLVEGHAREMPASQPPRGLQLELRRGDIAVDTIVMANLGYFQFKAGPGPWNLALRPGRSEDIYEFESVGANGWKSGSISQTGDRLSVTTLEGLTLYPRLVRRPGQELAELLDDTPTGPSAKELLDSALRKAREFMPFFAKKTQRKPSSKADINIFTVASGLLYERMAFIMMTSVMKHTKSSVKFWFIQNFLSPSFKAFIPRMAKEYGFEYELVTYKWPHWLRGQKEKQRLIWGYKILFLDVLFPLDLDRVIFVDSDQIVRADLKELADLDLEGAPYAYAPMGNDREETAGFRFWDSGYWKEHLQGRPYHISALYVVDLNRFRKMAAGDRLRQQYQALSADPGSLANLDQDLPNNMQHSIPIHTLDRSWLWCETWCSDESLASAKTIDLCNNPMTHEPKLTRAKRLIPEWTMYDDEVAALARRVASKASSTHADGQHSDGSTNGASEAIDAFGKRADELEQAVQQKNERDEFVGSSSETSQPSAEEQEPEKAVPARDEL